MSKMKSMLGLYAAMAMMGTSSGPVSDEINRSFESESEEERSARLKAAEIKRYKQQGLTEFFYGENSLWALNQKTADKKAKKRNWV